MKILGLGYQSGVGKDLCADYIQEQYGFLKRPFAYHLKVSAHESYGHLGVREPDYYEGPSKEERRNETYGPLNWNIVQFWVHMNTLCVPEPRHWIDLNLNGFKEGNNYVIPDVRKEIEIQAIKELGGHVAWVNRSVPDKPEAKIDNQLRGKENLFDYTIDNTGSFIHTAISIAGLMDEFFGINGTLEQ